MHHTQSAGKKETGGKSVERGKDSEGQGRYAKCRKISTSFPGSLSSWRKHIGSHVISRSQGLSGASLREEEIGLWERVCGEEGTLYQYQEKLHTKVTDVTASHKKKYVTSNN